LTSGAGDAWTFDALGTEVAGEVEILACMDVKLSALAGPVVVPSLFGPVPSKVPVSVHSLTFRRVCS
jgi:hypothetical protein